MSWPYTKVTNVSLATQLARLTQRTGGSVGALRTEGERISFQISTKEDLANALRQLNSVYYNLARTLSDETDLDALQFGLSGNVIYTDIEATESSGTALWDDSLARGKTIKETIATLVSEISRLENAIEGYQGGDASAYDDSEVRALIEANALNIDQLSLDGFGSSYALNANGAASLTYSLADHIDALGALFSGFPGTGMASNPDYPALTLTGSWAYETSGNVTRNSKGSYSLDDFVHGSSSLDDTGSAANDSRFMFDKSKGAFRAGIVTGTEWDNSNRGASSAAFGYNTSASGTYAFASGFGGRASNHGVRTLANGYRVTAGDAQVDEVIWRGTTNNATPTEIFLGGVASERYTVADATQGLSYELHVTAWAPTVGDINTYKVLGRCRQFAGLWGGYTSNITDSQEDDASWTVSVTGANPDKSLVVLVTGAAATNIIWVAYGRIVKAA